MNKIRFIGDVHGKFSRYREIIRDIPRSIQVGDMGIGFIRRDGSFSPNPPHDAMRQGNHTFIRGNHDNPNVCREHTQWIKDGFIENDMMFIGGALSIDRMWRTRDYDWWHGEELSIEILNGLIDIYDHVRPRIMVTHECPEEIARHYLAKINSKIEDSSRTRQAFQAMYEIHKPELWIHGHWHVSSDQKVNGTRFICLNELEFIDLDVDFQPKPE